MCADVRARQQYSTWRHQRHQSLLSLLPPAHCQRALPVVLAVHNNELNYFTIRSCFFLVSSVPCLYTCIQ
jgi:hypothetical protein